MLGKGDVAPESGGSDMLQQQQQQQQAETEAAVTEPVADEVVMDVKAEEGRSAASDSTNASGTGGDEDGVAADAVARMTSGYPQFELELRDLCRDVVIPQGKCGKGKKRILFDMNTRFVSGELTALMGPSGAGKSSLLSEISNGNNPAMYLNGQPIPRKFRDLVAVIPQADVLFPALTPRQTLRYSAQLRLPEGTPKEEIEAVVDRIIEDLNIGKCQDTPVGDENRRGVSGGERKRVSIGTELVVNPAILLVDEPSSGLDSTAAESVVEVLRKLCKVNGQMVICTIHQPSWKLFCSFDKLVLAHQGRVVYSGQNKDKLVGYFEGLGYEAPARENPLDYWFRILQQNDKEDQDFFADKWAALTDDERAEFDSSKHVKGSEGITNDAVTAMAAKNSWFHQYSTLTRRFMQDTTRDKAKFMQAIAMKFAIGLLLGLVFVGQARKDTVASIFTRVSPLFFLVISAVFDTAFASILIIPLTRPLLVRELRNQAYSVTALFVSMLTNFFIFDTISSLFYAIAVPIVGLFPSAWQFFSYLLFTTLITAWGSALGLWLGSTSKDIQEAQSKMIPIVMPLLLFCGFLLPYSELGGWEFAYWLSPFQYALSSLLIIEFEPETFSDGPPNTGIEYLETQNLDPDDLWRNCGILIAINVFMYVIGFASIRHSLLKQAREGA